MHSACKRALADISLAEREELEEDNMRERRIFPLATSKWQTTPGEGGLIRYRHFIGIGSKKSIYFYFIRITRCSAAGIKCI